MLLRWLICIILSAVLYCEFFGDFIKLAPCKWPTSKDRSDVHADDLHAMIIADTHLLGPFRGHWLDKLYREWHMRRTFQAALILHRPDVIFVLGDLFDEGDMVDHDDFKDYVIRFRSHFHAPNTIPLISAVGNHDVGFHYKMNPYYMERFEEEFKNTGVQLYTIRNNHFVFINSMALENDGCGFCEAAIKELHKVSDKLNCLKRPEKCTDLETLEKHKHYSRPIILQHFPTYRKSDKSCREHDSPYIEEYRENWEVLSKNSTDWIGKVLRPRLAFAGHSHNYCFSINRWGIEEYTVASFSWRNKINPSFLMASLTPMTHSIYKCDMLEQQHVYAVYGISIGLSVILIACNFLKWLYFLMFSKPKNNIKIH